MRTISLLALALSLGITLTASDPVKAQPAAKGPQSKALILYGQFRDLMNDGRYDIAANFLQAFLAASPTPADYLEIERKYGTTTFTMLRTIPKWSDDRAFDQKARANVEEAIKQSRAATEKLLHDPARVQKYIRNLGATYEERVFAELELKRTGDYAIPFMVEELRITNDKDLTDGILDAIKMLEPQTIAGWIAGLDGLPLPKQYGVMTAIVARPDILTLQSAAQTDLMPLLWRAMSLPADASPTVHAGAERLLNILLRGSGKKAEARIPVEELVEIAKTFYNHKARYSGVRKNPDSADSTFVWVWDASNPQAPKLVKEENVLLRQADEYYGLRYARWALEAKPDYEPAQGLILAIAAERAIERAKFGRLAIAEPAVYKVLADAPSSVLNDLLNQGLNQKRTPLVLSMIQVLGTRGDRAAATPPLGGSSRPALLVRALDYPDPEVQIAAANALLRSPVPVPPAVRGRVVEILRRAAALDNFAPESAKGTALIADPNRARGESLASLYRGIGYNVELFKTGRDLLRRIQRASDFDVLMIDYHTADPELIDIVGQLDANVNTARRPVFVVASPDKPPMPTYDQLLVRFACLVAATENEIVAMPEPYFPDPRADPEQIEARRKTIAENRDGVFRTTAAARMARLQRVIDSTSLELTPTQRQLLALRVELITYTVLGIEYPISPESAPVTASRIAEVRKQIDRQPPGMPYGAGPPTRDLMNLAERFELDLARVPSARKRFENLYSKVDPVALGLPVETFRDRNLEAALERTLRNYPAVRIIPEPYSGAELSTDLAEGRTQPGQGPRDIEAKKRDQKLAVEWLRKMATGGVGGFDVKSAEPELRSALRNDDLAADAIDGLLHFRSAESQQAILNVALGGPPANRPMPLRVKAADAAIVHIQANGKLVPKPQVNQIVEELGTETDAVLRGKLMILKGMLAYDQADFANQLRTFNPPLVPQPPPKLPPKDGKEPDNPKQPEVKQ